VGRSGTNVLQSTVQGQIQRELLLTHGISTNDRRTALQVARALQSQLFFYEVEWGSRALQDSVEDVYMFLDDMDGASDAPRADVEGLPTGVILLMTKCYSPACTDEDPCYAFACPRKVSERINRRKALVDGDHSGIRNCLRTCRLSAHQNRERSWACFSHARGV
jgi:hypothetical protein